MPGYESPLGNKKTATSRKLKQFVVPDESEFPNQNASPEEVRNYRNKFRTDINVDQESIRSLQERLNADIASEQFSINQENDAIEVERQIKEAREAKKTGITRLNDGAKRRIEMLIGMIRGTRDVEIGGNIFILRTLSSIQMRESIMEASKFDHTVESPFEVRRRFLARSIIKVATVNFAQFIGSNDFDAKLAFVDELPSPIIQVLYSEYLEMVKENDEKYSIKNSEDAKELVDDLKK